MLPGIRNSIWQWKSFQKLKHPAFSCTAATKVDKPSVTYKSWRCGTLNLCSVNSRDVQWERIQKLCPRKFHSIPVYQNYKGHHTGTCDQQVVAASIARQAGRPWFFLTASNAEMHWARKRLGSSPDSRVRPCSVNRLKLGSLHRSAYAAAGVSCIEKLCPTVLGNTLPVLSQART